MDLALRPDPAGLGELEVIQGQRKPRGRSAWRETLRASRNQNAATNHAAPTNQAGTYSQIAAIDICGQAEREDISSREAGKKSKR